jgi:ATP-dependent Clp protease ATP-binding subunit ClpA
VLELSLRESTQLGHDYIGTEHILLGLIREGEGVAAQVLVRLGADLNRVRQQVIQLLHGYQGREGISSGSWSALASRGGRLDHIGARLDAIGDRLAAIEHRLGIGPGPRPEALRELDRSVDEVRTEKEQAINAMNFERAAALRDTENQLILERDTAEKQWLAGRKPGTGTGAAEYERLRLEVERLQALLRRHDIDPGGDPPPGAAAGA